MPEKFGVKPNSIEALLHTLAPETQRKYRRNRAVFEAEARAMEQWARDGFIAQPERLNDDD